MEYIKKGTLGYSATKSDTNATHVALDISEYTALLNEIRNYTVKIKELEVQVKHVQRHGINEQNKLLNANVQLHEQLDNLSSEYEEMKNELVNKTNHNNFLLKIMKERANADRRLQPKKQHSGYVFLSTTTEEYKFKEDGKQCKVKLFKSTFQTPYNMDCDYEFVFEHVVNNFLNLNEGKQSLLQSIGILGKEYFNSYEELLEDKQKNVSKIYQKHYLQSEKDIKPVFL